MNQRDAIGEEDSPVERVMGQSLAADRVLFVVDQDTASRLNASNLDWRSLWAALRSDWMMLLASGAVLALAALSYSMLAEKWYTSEVTLSPADRSSNQSVIPSQLGGLASLAGISLPSANEGGKALAVLESRAFLTKFVSEEGLVETILSPGSGAMGADVSSPNEDARSAAGVLSKYVLAVERLPEQGLVQLTVTWTDPEEAALWANRLVERLNDHMRERELESVGKNVDYLQDQMMEADVAVLRQSIAAILQGEMQRLMLARGSDEFSFTVIDPALAARQPSRPRPFLLVPFGLILGLILGATISLVRAAVREHP